MIHEVDAPEDARIAPYARVGDHAWLTARGLFVAEGRLILERLLDAGGYTLHSVLVTPAALAALRRRLELLESDVYVAPQPVLNTVTGFNFHRGCLALAYRRPAATLDQLASAHRLLLAEGVGNPDNVGGLFRAAAALGCEGLVIDARTADPFYRKALRTSMGAALRVPFTRVDDLTMAVQALRARGFRSVALTPEASASALHDAANRIGAGTRIALLVGAEGAGLSEGALAAADERVRIPMASGVDSLNVVVAAAIALYAFADRSGGPG